MAELLARLEAQPADIAGTDRNRDLVALCERSLADLAARAHLSASQLQREFRRLFGMTPGDYILKIRLHMARRELEQTDRPVGRIALDCGFYDQSHFTRSFRSDTGLRPLDYGRAGTVASNSALVHKVAA